MPLPLGRCYNIYRLHCTYIIDYNANKTYKLFDIWSFDEDDRERKYNRELLY